MCKHRIMAALGNILTFGIIILFLTQVHGVVRSDCPVGCGCEPETKAVKCGNNNWREFPPLPKETREFHVKGDFGMLKKPKACQTYSHVIYLEIGDNDITHIADDAFSCMPRLRSLTLYARFIENISAKVFRYTPMMENISLGYYNPKNDPHRNINICLMMCEILSLQRLELSLINLMPNSLECFTSLVNLSYVVLKGSRMSHFISEPITQVLKPLKHVSQYIALNIFNITSLTDNVFHEFEVQTLDLSYNKIRHISKNVFLNMKKLKILHLKSNRISETIWLEKLSLEMLFLEYNLLWRIPHSPKVREMHVTGNKFHLTSGSVSGFRSLEKLDLSHSDIFLVERNSFYNLPKMEVLLLNQNSIDHRNLRNLLSDLVRCSLKTLDLSQNPLNSLDRTFDEFKLKQLEILVLCLCGITEIQPYMFKNFNNLQTLLLENNEITEIGLNAFYGLRNLTHLDLSGNNLKIFDASLNGLQTTSLTELILKNSVLPSKESKKFSVFNISTLIHIDLSFSDIIFRFDTFKNLISLKTLLVPASSLGGPFLVGNLPSFPSLSILDVSGNPSLYILPGYFLQTPNLEFLDISKYSLSPDQQKELFGILVKLRRLYVNECSITVLIPNMFGNLHQLEELQASSNNIYSVQPSAFWNLSNLKILYLDKNLITHVTWESFTSLPNLRYLSLAGNPLLCTCDILWLYQAITTNNMVFMLRAYEHHCLSPLDVAGISLTELNLEVFDCEDNWLLVLKPVSYVLLTLVVLLLVHVTWRYRWKIRYTLFLARAGHGRYEECCDDHEYIYDAFVAYSGDDLPWVKDQLLPNIDTDYLGQAGFKLCIHHRDWLGGVDIVENIVKSIAESRRTIIVLSKDFAMSRWCQFELAMAHLRLDAEGHKKGRLLVILLDDIPPELLSPRLVYFLSMKTYLTWPDDPDSQRIFWKTLSKSLKKEFFYATPV